MTRQMQSDYMDFAKFGADARYNLATSGVANADLSDLALSWSDLALHGPNAGGYQPLVEAVAARFGVDPACVVMPGGGCSFANHLALAGLVSPGDEVLVEWPSYELLTSTLGYLQADVRRFERKLDESWRLDPYRVEAALTPKTKVVVLTNLHNPTGAYADEETIQAVAEAAAKVGAMVFVDEVYRELLFADGEAQTSFREKGNIVVTSSLTKAYGVTGLRCGWILAPAPLAQKLRRLNDLYGVHPPHIAERMSVVALERLPQLRARATALIDAGRAAYKAVLGSHPKLSQVVFEHGTTVFPRLLEGDGDRFFQKLIEQFETSIVPGRFFGLSRHIRIGLAADPHATRIGLGRVAAALEE
jgi:aspartate/methionine/tyrosine aminotransferase